MSEFTPRPAERTPAPTSEVDSRLEQVSSLQVALKESEGSFTIIGYGSNPRESSPYWIIHVMDAGKVVYETTTPRLDLGNDFSHNDIIKLHQAVDRLKSLINPTIDTM